MFVTNNLLEYVDFLQNNNAAIGISGIAQNTYSAQMYSTNPYYSPVSRAGVIPPNTLDVTTAVVLAFSKPDLWSQLFFWILLSLFVANILWLIEGRGQKNKDFRSNYTLGVFDGFYWSGVTTSTVGYGDKVPKNSAGKCVTLIWMLFGFFFTLTVSATLTSLVTISQLTPPPLSIEDFRAESVGVIKHFPLIDQLLSVNGLPIEYNTLVDGYQSLLNGTTRYFIADQASMATLNTTETTIILLGPSFGSVDFVFAVAPSLGSAVIDQLNKAILTLQFTNPIVYRTLIEQYFNHTYSNSVESPILEDSVQPFILFIVWAIAIVILLMIMLIIHYCTRNGKKENTGEDQNN